MGVLYILQSMINGRYYIGSTNNFERRFREHNDGLSKYTKLTRPFTLVFSKEFDSLEQARKAETKLKKLKSRKIIEKIVKSGEILIKDE